MATFVIVHGGWGGGWEWSAAARALRASGHDVFTPTLTGMGERSHVSADDVIGLAVHIEDVVSVLELEDLHDVVLCAASYGGMPVTGAAERCASRVSQVVYVDALVPRDGQSALDLLPPEFGDVVRAGVAAHGAQWRVPLPAGLRDTLVPAGSLPDAVRAAYLSRLRDHPAASFIEPLRLTGAIERVPRAFVRCTATDFTEDFSNDPIAACAARARADGWPCWEFPAPHDPQLFDPVGIAALLAEVSGAA